MSILIRKRHICYNEDIEFDFGGHTWAGRISWLRKAWNHVPLSFEYSEDFWISAVLKSYYNISTKIPRCPCPQGNPIAPDLCAASHISASKHENAKVGDKNVTTYMRKVLIKEITNKFNFQRLIYTKPGYVNSIYRKYAYGNKFFNLSEPMWDDVLYWQ